MRCHGWTLLFHDCLIDQLRKLHNAVQRARRSDPTEFASNANVKLFRALSRLMLEVIPQDPSRNKYRQGSTLGWRYRHWRRARIGRRFRLFFRYDAKAKVIIYAWVNDQSTLRLLGQQDRSVQGLRQDARAGESARRLGLFDDCIKAGLAVGEITASRLRRPA